MEGATNFSSGKDQQLLPPTKGHQPPPMPGYQPPPSPGYQHPPMPGYQPPSVPGYQPASMPEYQPAPANFKGSIPPPYHMQPPIQQQQSTVTIVQQPSTPTTTTRRAVGDNYLTLSIAMTIVCCIFFPGGGLFCTIPAIVFASMARDAEAHGKYAAARYSSNVAAIWNITAVVGWVIFVILIITILLA